MELGCFKVSPSIGKLAISSRLSEGKFEKVVSSRYNLEIPSGTEALLWSASRHELFLAHGGSAKRTAHLPKVGFKTRRIAPRLACLCDQSSTVWKRIPVSRDIRKRTDLDHRGRSFSFFSFDWPSSYWLARAIAEQPTQFLLELIHDRGSDQVPRKVTTSRRF